MLRVATDAVTTARLTGYFVRLAKKNKTTNVAAYSRERPQTSEPGSVVCPAQSI